MPETPREYKPVPVEAAKAVSQQFDKDLVVIVAHDPAFGRVELVTFGPRGAAAERLTDPVATVGILGAEVLRLEARRDSLLARLAEVRADAHARLDEADAQGLAWQAEIGRLRAALAGVQKMAEFEIEYRRALPGSHLHQIEADARAALEGGPS